MGQTATDRIASIIGNRPLATAICRSVSLALKSPFVHLDGGNTVWRVFERSLRAAIRDIEDRPRAKLFRRLIEYGPRNPDEPEALSSDGKTTLSDPECGACVEFIFSHMVNRFKGELAELLAIEPCITLARRLLDEGRLPSNIELHLGDAVHERRYRKSRKRGAKGHWGQFAKGADGVLVEQTGTTRRSAGVLKVHGVIEVKSMALSKNRIAKQIDKHVSRLKGGVKLGKREWSPDAVDRCVGLRIMVRPSTWKLSRQYQWAKTETGRALVLPDTSGPPAQLQIERVSRKLWMVTLPWSQEALEEAAYTMTFWYMGQVGEHVYSTTPLPSTWQEMTQEQAGRNSIKMMLYYTMLRYLSKRHDRLATKLYNVYCFGYALGVDSREMLWPEDFPEDTATA
jgi:hypothetical protein